MIEQVTHLMVNSGAAWVLWLLFALSFVSVAVAVERAWVFRGSAGHVDQLVPALRKLLRADDHARAAELLRADASVVGRVVEAGLAESDLGSEAAAEAMSAAIGLERKRLEGRLLILGTIGNNAPFIGLLGTVIGVVGAFDALGRPASGAADAVASALAPERVMSTIAEALVATAVGLVVAIPAVAIFNYFQGRVATVIADAETLGHVLLSHLRAEHDGRPLPRTLAKDQGRARGGERASHAVRDLEVDAETPAE
jgi:biopolymer transport protein ExbB